MTDLYALTYSKYDPITGFHLVYELKVKSDFSYLIHSIETSNNYEDIHFEYGGVLPVDIKSALEIIFNKHNILSIDKSIQSKEKLVSLFTISFGEMNHDLIFEFKDTTQNKLKYIYSFFDRIKKWMVNIQKFEYYFQNKNLNKFELLDYQQKDSNGNGNIKNYKENLQNKIKTSSNVLTTLEYNYNQFDDELACTIVVNKDYTFDAIIYQEDFHQRRYFTYINYFMASGLLSKPMVTELNHILTSSKLEDDKYQPNFYFTYNCLKIHKRSYNHEIITIDCSKKLKLTRQNLNYYSEDLIHSINRFQDELFDLQTTISHCKYDLIYSGLNYFNPKS